MQASIHIGIGKTGTTSIQSFLSNNDEHLRPRHVLYPVAGRVGATHYGFFDVNDGTLNEAAFQQLAGEIKDSNCRHVIISSESLIYAPLPAVRRLKAELGEDVRVIVYAREQIGLISSVFLQWVKVGSNYEGSIEKFLERHQASFDYMKLIKPWVDEFGDDRIEAHLYDEAVVGASVVNHFLGLVGLADIGTPQDHYNPSLVPELFPAIKRLDEEGLAGPVRQEIVELLLSASVQLRKSSVMSLMTNETYARIAALYRESNEQFAARYLPQEERPHFRLRLPPATLLDRTDA